MGLQAAFAVGLSPLRQNLIASSKRCYRDVSLRQVHGKEHCSHMGKTLSLLLASAPQSLRVRFALSLNLAAVTAKSTYSLVAARPQPEMTSGAHSSKLCALLGVPRGRHVLRPAFSFTSVGATQQQPPLFVPPTLTYPNLHTSMELTAVVDQILVFAFTFAANLFASVSGGGAGFVQFPMLILMGLPFATALGTHKVAVVFLGIGALAKKKSSHTQYGLDKHVAIAMMVLGCPAVVSGTLIVINVPSQAAEITVGMITIAMGVYTLVKKGFGSTGLEHRSPLRFALGCLCIIVIGMFSGSLSSGAGLFATLALTLVFGLELKRAILHTMVFVATIWNAVGAITVGAVTSIYWQWVPVMIIAAFMGSFLGTSLLFKLPVEKVRIIFSCVAILSGVLLVYTAF